jgi:hypothetical protein
VNKDKIKELNNRLKEVVAKERVRLIAQYSPKYIHFLQHLNVLRGEHSLKISRSSDMWYIEVEYEGSAYKCEPEILMNKEKTALEYMCKIKKLTFSNEEKKHFLKLLRQNGMFKIFNI